MEPFTMKVTRAQTISILNEELVRQGYLVERSEVFSTVNEDGSGGFITACIEARLANGDWVQPVVEQAEIEKMIRNYIKANGYSFDPDLTLQIAGWDTEEFQYLVYKAQFDGVVRATEAVEKIAARRWAESENTAESS